MFYTMGMNSAFLSDRQSPKAIKEVTDGFDLMKLNIFGMATNIMSKVEKKNYWLEKCPHNKCQEVNFIYIYRYLLNQFLKQVSEPTEKMKNS